MKQLRHLLSILKCNLIDQMTQNTFFTLTQFWEFSKKFNHFKLILEESYFTYYTNKPYTKTYFSIELIDKWLKIDNLI